VGVSYCAWTILIFSLTASNEKKQQESKERWKAKNSEKAATAARLGNFRAKAKRHGLKKIAEVEEQVQKWEEEYQRKHGKVEKCEKEEGDEATKEKVDDVAVVGEGKAAA
jgi:hypothetical protein